MTAQVSDRVIFNNHTFYVAGINGGGLFDPADHGITPSPNCTACWRGFECDYAVVDDILRLRQVEIALGETDVESVEIGKGPQIFGADITRFDEIFRGDTREGLHDFTFTRYRYVDLHEHIEFTGGLLIAKDFIHELYVHMGFHPAYKYHDVFELIFEGGRLVEATDRSQLMAEFRDSIRHHRVGPDPRQSMAEVEKWIEQCFSLDYQL